MVKNDFGIKHITIESTAKCYCPLGNDWYTNQFTVDFIPGEFIPDYCELDNWIAANINGKTMIMVAMEVTEEQVFQPERQSLAWIINSRLLNAYQFKHVEVFFKSPDISNPDDLFKILTVCNNAGGLTPNKAKDIAYKALGETAEDFPAEWGDTPIAVQKSQSMTMPPDFGALTAGIEKQIAKATAAHDDAAIVAVMKEVKSLLVKMSKEG